MKPTGTGRILLWRGGSLWIGRSGEPTDFHSHHSIQIALPFTAGGVRFRRPGGSWIDYPAAIVAAHAPHAYEARGESVAMLFAEPESREGQALQQLGHGDAITALATGPAEHELAALVTAYERIAPDAELIDRARSVIGKLAAASPSPAATLDRRIERAVELLRERIGEPVLLAEIADAVLLSPDRFRHLFIEQTGMRFRPYVLWLRIELALAEFAAHRSLTEAAHAGGFADSAHLSRTFKRMFGIAPSSFQREQPFRSSPD
jgi:transcriptional regulator GlxA family with amidase domain